MQKILLSMLIVSCVFTTIRAETVQPSSSWGIVVGNNVRLRALPTTSSEIFSTLNSGDVVTILDHSAEPEQLIKSREFSYYWYKVKAGNKTAWIYGQFLYSLDSSSLSSENTIFNFAGKRYKILIFNEQEISYDMPDQDSYSLPVLYNTDTGGVYLLNIRSTSDLYSHIKYRGAANDYNFFLFIGNTGFGDSFDGPPLVSDSSLLIPVSVGFQEGGATWKMKISWSSTDNRFQITDILDYQVEMPDY